MIAIHHVPGGFSDKWIEYCEQHGIKYKVVNCFDTDIIDQLRDCKGLMWHWSHSDSKAANFARQLTCSLEHVGIPVFPNSRTVWHFDDKVGQKYLLEASGIPHVPTYVFYDENAALEWARKQNYPLVFKLRRGAGSMNVMLIQNFRQAKSIIKRSFGKGWRDQNRLHVFRDRVWHFKRDRSPASFLNIGKGIARIVIPHPTFQAPRIEHGYAYFQEFIPSNDHDIRVIVIGDRAFAIKRMVREGDFRASGSGAIRYDPAEIPIECVRLAFDASRQLRAQCLAYDFVFKGGTPLIVEISYAFLRTGYLACPGYWDIRLNWHDGHFAPEWFMIEDFLAECATAEGTQYDTITIQPGRHKEYSSLFS